MRCASSPPTSRTTSRPSSAWPTWTSPADTSRTASAGSSTFIGRNFGPERETARVRLLELFDVVGTGDERVAKARQGPGPGAVLVGSALFAPLELRSLRLQHRGWVSPMCQYSCGPGTGEGVPTDWHLMHLGSFATGGSGPDPHRGQLRERRRRISPRDAGLYNDDQAAAWERITSFVHRHGTAETKIGTQLAHAGRKASSYWPFSGKKGSVAAVRGRLGHRGSRHRRLRRLRAAVGHDGRADRRRDRRLRRGRGAGRRRRASTRSKSMAPTATSCTSSRARSSTTARTAGAGTRPAGTG